MWEQVCTCIGMVGILANGIAQCPVWLRINDTGVGSLKKVGKVTGITTNTLIQQEFTILLKVLIE